MVAPGRGRRRGPARPPFRSRAPPLGPDPGRPAGGGRGCRPGRGQRGGGHHRPAFPCRDPPTAGRGRRGAVRPRSRHPVGPGRPAGRDSGRCAGGPRPFRRLGRLDARRPCFLYGPERSLPDVRRLAFRSAGARHRAPTPIPRPEPPRSGVRPLLVAYNVWITGDGGDRRPATAPCSTWPVPWPPSCGARRCAASGFPSGSGAQVSFNLIDPGAVSLADLYDAVAAGARSPGMFRAPGRAGRAGPGRRPRGRAPPSVGRNSTWPRTGPSRPAWTTGGADGQARLARPPGEAYPVRRR